MGTMPVSHKSPRPASSYICLPGRASAHPGAGAHPASHIQAEALTLGTDG